MWRFLKKLELELPYDPAIHHCWAYTLRKPELKETHVPPMFIAALFIIARTWKQPRGPSTEEWIKKMWYIYTRKCSVQSLSCV